MVALILVTAIIGDSLRDRADSSLFSYSNENKFEKALEELFPVGTPRSIVEERLAHEELNWAVSPAEDNSYYIYYSEPNKDAGMYRRGLRIYGLSQARIKYDGGNKVLDITAQILTGQSHIKFFFQGERIDK